MRRKQREQQGDRAHGDIDGGGDEGRGRHVIYAQQVEAGQQAAEHGAGNVAAVEEPEPGDPARRRSRSSGPSHGSVAPISTVGGSRTEPRSDPPARECR